MKLTESHTNLHQELRQDLRQDLHQAEGRLDKDRLSKAAPCIPDATDTSRTALVTGGSRGIGRAICLVLAKMGCSVAINYAHNRDEAEITAELCAQVASEAGYQTARFVCLPGDIALGEACEDVFNSCCSLLGAPDILVNNAGITRDNLILRMSIEDYDKVLAVNLRAAFIFCKLAARPMIKQRSGRIINITSVAGLNGNVGQANYAASKAGLIGLTKTLARELGSRGVTVNAVAPGFIQTEMTEGLNDEVRANILDLLALKRMGSVDDVAAAVAFLASDAASYITGQVLTVDGGMTI